MNELWLGLALGFTGASFSYLITKPLSKIEWLNEYYCCKGNGLCIWTQRAIALVFTILWLV